MSDPISAPDFWLEGGVLRLYDGAEAGFLPEVDRIIERLGRDVSWLEWWRRVSKAPVLELQIFLTHAPRSEFAAETLANVGADERVVRGRRRHLVRMHADFDELAGLEPDERRVRALPVVLDGIDRARQTLKLNGEPPSIPEGVRPASLSPSTLRRQRLKALLDTKATRPVARED